MSNGHLPTEGDGDLSTERDGDLSTAEDGSEVTGDELDDLLAALADGTRRCVLAHLDGTDDGVAAFSDLVDRVADDPTAGRPADRERVAVSLHHDHLPTLEDVGVVTYDPTSGTVRYRGGRAVDAWLALARTYESDYGVRADEK